MKRKIHRLIHFGVPTVERWLEIKPGKWTHYPVICSRCDPNEYYIEYKRMIELCQNH